MVKPTEQDMKWLQANASRTAWWGRAVMAAAPVLNLALSGFHIWLASLWAHMDGLTFGEAWRGWLDGIHPGQYYSGTYLKAMEQFDKGAIFLAYALISVVLWWTLNVDYQRRARLLALFEGKA